MFSSIALQTSTARPACVSTRQNSRVQRQSVLRVVAIGQVNDPEKVKKEKERKRTEGQWAEPKNKNPLEKKSLIHGETGGDAEKAKGIVEDIGDAVKDVAKKVQGK